MSDKLFSEFECEFLGSLKNKIVMSAMTRGFADSNHCCTKEIADYYVRRSENGVALILTEGIVIDPSADGYNNVPHIATQEQSDSWKDAISRIHENKSKVIAQLWHCGRISHSDYTGGVPPVSSTSIAAEGLNRQNNKPYGVPEALSHSQIRGVIEMYVKATEKALLAGFDAVQIHMGHGYLIDQFFDSRVNDREDNYGGSVENRCRFALEVVNVLVDKFGEDKIMIRISPSRFMGEIYDWPNLEEMLAYLIPQLAINGLRMLDVSCANAVFSETSGRVINEIHKIGWDGIIMGGASLSLQDASSLVDSDALDLVTWGRAILANVDFVEKLEGGSEISGMTNEMREVLF